MEGHEGHEEWLYHEPPEPLLHYLHDEVIGDRGIRTETAVKELVLRVLRVW